MDLVTQIKQQYPPKKYEAFLSLMGEFKQIVTRGGAPDTVQLSARMHKLIGKDKELWVKFVGYLPSNSREKMKLKRESRKLRQPKMPINSSQDTFLLIAKRLPLLSLARLSQTCLWANVQITPAMFKAARARLTHGVFSLGSALVIRDANDDPITISPVDEGLSSLRVQMNGGRYVAEDTSGNGEMAALLAGVLGADDKMKKKTKIWYRRQSGVYIDISVSNDGQIVKKASMVCILP